MKSIAEHWADTEAKFFDGMEPTDAQRHDMRSSFFMGALSVFSMLSDVGKAASTGEAPEDALNAIADELAVFVHSSITAAVTETVGRVHELVTDIDAVVPPR